MEKHINSIFSKLDLPEADVNRRVKAVLLFLAEQAELKRGGPPPLPLERWYDSPPSP